MEKLKTVQTAEQQISNTTRIFPSQRAAIAASVLSLLSACGARSSLNLDGAGGSPPAVDAGGTGGTAGADTGGAGGSNEIPKECDKLNVKVASEQSGKTIPKNASNVPFACWDFKNGCESRSLDSITIKDIGVGDVSDIKVVTVGLWAGEKTFDPATNKVTFNSLNLTLDPEELMSLCAYVDVFKDAMGGNTHRFTIETKEDIETSAPKIDGVFPLSGPTMTIGGATAGSISIHQSSFPPGSLNPGQTNGVLARFNLQLDTVEDAEVDTLTLQIISTCPLEKISSVKLMHGTTTIAGPVAIDIDETSIEFLDKFILTAGTIKELEVRADQNCEAGQDIKICLWHENRLEAYGTTFGFGLAVDNKYRCINAEWSSVSIK